MENCGFATNETVPARIVAASLDPKILKAAGRLVAGRRVRSATSLRREHLRIMRGLIAEKKLDPLFSQRQAVERAMSGISSRNMAAMRKMNRNALGEDLDKFHSLANEKLNTPSALTGRKSHPASEFLLQGARHPLSQFARPPP